MNMCKTLILILVIVATAVSGQGTLIGPTMRNGSFEDGVAAPWFGGFSVVQDSNFASEGSWYGVVQSSIIRPTQAIQNITANPSAGLSFSVSFDARVGTPGFDLLSIQMGGRTVGGSPLSASVTPIITPPLTTLGWQSYQFLLQTPESWNSAGLTFAIQFNNTQPLGGVSHYGYLDNIILQQIPEPSSLALLLTGGILARRFIRRCKLLASPAV